MRTIKMLCTTMLLVIRVSTARAEAPPQFLLEWGSVGSGDGQFTSPTGIAVRDGKVYVVDGGLNGNGRVEVFSTDGAYIAQWGSKGSSAGQFNQPVGIAIAPDGSVYVADYGNHRIQKFTDTGDYLLAWNAGEGLASSPIGVGVNSEGNVYVTIPHFTPSSLANQVQEFTSAGALLAQWGADGEDEGQFTIPGGLTVAPDGTIYVADYNHHVQKFTGAGVFLDRWGSFGEADGQFKNPSALAIDSHGNVYVTELFGARVQKFTGAGEFLTKWGSAGSGDGQFSNVSVQGIAVDEDGNVYVADTGNYRIQKFGVPFQTVALDVEPQECPNTFNIGARGVLPVAILGTSNFDVAKIDPLSVRLAGVPLLRSSLADVATPYAPFIPRQNATDCTAAGPDGFVDLTLKIDRQALSAALGIVADGEVLLMRLTGNLRPEFGGTPIQGEDIVSILSKP